MSDCHCAISGPGLCVYVKTRWDPDASTHGQSVAWRQRHSRFTLVRGKNHPVLIYLRHIRFVQVCLALQAPMQDPL